MTESFAQPSIQPSRNGYDPTPALFDTPIDPSCRACVIVPARNEEKTLPATLDALRQQQDASGSTLDPCLYETIVLVNNCTDNTHAAAGSYQARYPSFRLRVAERTLPPEAAHVGTARRLLMDTAYLRLRESVHPHTAILSTDADTTVAPDWIARNLDAIAAGADAVGGVIDLRPADLAALDAGTLRAYRADREYQRLVARLESLLDPDPADPWPRHLEHFGASLACTPQVYARAGGMPPVSPLEDVAFVDALRRVDARIRHAPEVRVFTSARMDGRARDGLSGQLRRWRMAGQAGEPQRAPAAAYLSHRFSSLAQLRYLGSLPCLPPLDHIPWWWHGPLRDQHPRGLGPSAFLCAIDCNRLIEDIYHGPREETMEQATMELRREIARLTHTACSAALEPEEPIDAALAAAAD